MDALRRNEKYFDQRPSGSDQLKLDGKKEYYV